jgi:hypothetical protein
MQRVYGEEWVRKDVYITERRELEFHKHYCYLEENNIWKVTMKGSILLKKIEAIARGNSIALYAKN